MVIINIITGMTMYPLSNIVFIVTEKTVLLVSPAAVAPQ